MNASALIVDDEPDIRELIALALGRIGLDTHVAANLAEARELLGTYAFDVCLTDMRLPDGNGLKFVRHVQSAHPMLPIAVITAFGNAEAAVEAMKGGAFDPAQARCRDDRRRCHRRRRSRAASGRIAPRVVGGRSGAARRGLGRVGAAANPRSLGPRPAGTGRPPRRSWA